MTTIDIRPQLNGRAAAIGLGLSLLVHVAVLAWLTRAPAPRPDVGEAPRRMVFVLVPPQPLDAPRTTEAPPAARAPAQPAPSRPRAPRAPGTKHLDTLPVPAAPAIDSSAPAASSASSADPEAAPPTVDLAAARAAARTIAREDAKGLVALPGRKPVTDPNADHHAVDRLERARRIDCQKARAESTNLLANVVGLAVDLVKNAVDDSGCKW